MGTVRYTVLDGEVVAEKRSGVRKEYVPDPLGSTAALLDPTQSATDTFSYWPYGEESSRTGTTATPFRYVGTLGYYRDSATGEYVRARYLHVQQGRWMTEDPIGLDGGDMNLYRYVTDRPATAVDPTGKSAKCDICAAALFALWYPSQTHYCEHEYTHCMTCCTLSRLDGRDCAMLNQARQNVWIDPTGKEIRWGNRFNLCRAGVEEGQKPGLCSDNCKKRFPFGRGKSPSACHLTEEQRRKLPGFSVPKCCWH